MSSKFPGTGEPGYHPLRTVFSGLRFAVFHDWAVACKLVLSMAVMTVAFALRV